MTLGICSANISIGVINLMASQVLSIENNRIIGIMGQCFDQFLVHKGIRCVYRIDSSSKLIPRRLLIDFLRSCTFKPIYELEYKIYPNESVEYLMNRNVRWNWEHPILWLFTLYSSSLPLCSFWIFIREPKRSFRAWRRETSRWVQ